MEEWRWAVHVRFNYTCQVCGLKEDPKKPTLQVHHIIPRSEGGTNDLFNLTLLCDRCHKRKHARAPKRVKYYDNSFFDENPDFVLDDYERYHYLEQDNGYKKGRKEVRERLKRLC